MGAKGDFRDTSRVVILFYNLDDWFELYSYIYNFIKEFKILNAYICVYKYCN